MVVVKVEEWREEEEGRRDKVLLLGVLVCGEVEEIGGTMLLLSHTKHTLLSDPSLLAGSLTHSLTLSLSLAQEGK